ncbi:MAG: hypothetical protein PHF50_04245 [Patescibacteria group bacterium]|nr:hypothetical protein [Patescibacteria group bacterium]
MPRKILHFIKYNNAMIIILAVILILGGGALAAGPENIGQKQTSVEGIDNTALLSADLENFNMDFKIENIEQDEKYYYVTYGFLDLAVINNAWQYQLSQKTQKVSKKIKEDIGLYMAKFMAKHYEARVRELKQEKSQAESQGEQKRIEVTEYSGLIGRTLDIASKVFPNYEPEVKKELPAPEINPLIASLQEERKAVSGTDNLTQIYNDYVAEHPEIFLTPIDTASSSSDAVIPETPAVQEDPAVPETPGITEPENVDVIELPAEAEAVPEPAPAPETQTEIPAE